MHGQCCTLLLRTRSFNELPKKKNCKVVMEFWQGSKMRACTVVLCSAQNCATDCCLGLVGQNFYKNLTMPQIQNFWILYLLNCCFKLDRNQNPYITLIDLDFVNIECLLKPCSCKVISCQVKLLQLLQQLNWSYLWGLCIWFSFNQRNKQ